MEHEFVICPHCSTLNFKDSRSCYYCTFRLPIVAEARPASFKPWQYILVCITLLSIVTLIVLAVFLNSSASENEEPEIGKSTSAAFSGK